MEVTKDIYEATLRQSYALLFMASQLPMADCLRAAERSESLGWVTDPTLWMLNQGKLSEDIKVLRAVRDLGLLAPQPVTKAAP